jgi:hypothetical protein
VLGASDGDDLLLFLDFLVAPGGVCHWMPLLSAGVLDVDGVCQSDCPSCANAGAHADMLTQSAVAICNCFVSLSVMTIILRVERTGN